jgi:glycosyltransferase involved in cell wall biosynthesis
MKVHILTKKIGKEPNIIHGILRYSANLIKGLIKRNITLYVYPDFNTYSALTSVGHDVALNPACILKSSISKVDVHHALFPSQALYFPFIKKSVVTFHDVNAYYVIGKSIKDLLWRRYEKIAYRCAKQAGHIIAVTEKTKNELVELLSIPEDKITVIYEGIDDRFKPSKKKGQKATKVIGYIGDISKGTVFLIRAFYHLQKTYKDLNYKLEIYGKDGYYKNLNKLCEKLRLKNVELNGFISDEKIVETYNSFDVFVFPSMYEGFGLPILEAQRCGLPVFVRADAKMPEEVKKVAIHALNELDMANKIYSVLTDDSLYKRISSRGLHYSKQFTWDNCVEETIKVYEKVSQR